MRYLVPPQHCGKSEVMLLPKATVAGQLSTDLQLQVGQGPEQNLAASARGNIKAIIVGSFINMYKNHLK